MTTASEPVTSLEPYACPLAEPRPLAQCGGKAYHLRRMLELELPVPPGLVVTNRAFEEFLTEAGLRPRIAECLAKLDPSRPDAYEEAARSICELVEAASVPAPVVEAIAELLSEFRPGVKLVVRSSAVGEDSQRAAFAGQLDSILHVDNEVDSIGQALLTCWASYWSGRVLFYQHSRGIPLAGMGVVVQEQVTSVVSGVLFTRHPDQSLSDSMLVEYCGGLGDALVSGRITPGRIVISRRDLSWRHEATPEDAATNERLAFLLAEHVAKLAEYALALEAAFGGPQDIEWTVSEDERLLLLQSRPIVGNQIPNPKSEIPNSTVWSNANVNENFPDPICPLLYSIAALGYYHYFRNLGLALGISRRRVAAMEGPLRNIVGVHGARLYYNLSNIHAVLRMAPLGDLLTESFDLFVGTSRTQPRDDRLTWRGFARGRISQACEAARIAMQSTWQFLFLSRRVARFEHTADGFANATRPDSLDGRPLAELRGHLRGFLEIRCHQWVNASLADAAAMLSYGLLKRTLSREVPGEEQAALHNSLLMGLRDVVSSKPALALWDLSRQIQADANLSALFADHGAANVLRELRSRAAFAPFLKEFDRFLHDWGFRCSGELMLTVPSFQERPEALVEMLRAYAQQDGESPTDRLARQNAQRVRETRRVLAALRRDKSLIVRWLLGCTQRAIVCRERAQLKQALLYSRCRRIVLAIGEALVQQGLLCQPDDVFFLTVQELDSLAAGSSMFASSTPELIALRRTAHVELCQLRPPDTFTLPEGSYWTAPATTPADDAAPGDEQRVLRGQGVCGGRATAPAAVLDNVTQFERLTRGDILVTRQTDPGWGPIFPLVQGLVIERGGMLSHGAILAREYGLPTVVGIADATRRIQPGQTITVDGDRGLVELA